MGYNIKSLKKIHPILFAVFLLLMGNYQSNSQGIKIAKLKYNGGGDWYANKTALPNLISFCNSGLNMGLALEEDIVEVGSSDLFLYPYI